MSVRVGVDGLIVEQGSGRHSVYEWRQVSGLVVERDTYNPGGSPDLGFFPLDVAADLWRGVRSLARRLSPRYRVYVELAGERGPVPTPLVSSDRAALVARARGLVDEAETLGVELGLIDERG